MEINFFHCTFTLSFFCPTVLSNPLPPTPPRLLNSALTPIPTPPLFVESDLLPLSNLIYLYIFLISLSSSKHCPTLFVPPVQSCPAHHHSLPLLGNFFSLPVCVCGTLPVGSRHTTASAAGTATATATAGLVEQGSAVASAPSHALPFHHLVMSFLLPDSLSM